MATVGKEAERAELHKTIWRIANDLRGSVDGWDFKAYVLGTLFYRFISENLADYLNERERKARSPDFDYTALSDVEAERGRRETVAEKGFYILPSELFANVRERARHDENLNETLSRVFRGIEGSAVGTASEDDIKGLFDDLDVNSSKLGPTVVKRNEKLVKLLDAIGDLDLDHADNTIDAFGDAYEFLMTMYASNAGKSGGEFFTPQEVSELLARITVVGKTEVNKVYDPACGSGSLLLKFAKVLGRENVRLGFFGQEVNLTTYNLCRINMFLHDVNYEKFDIAHGDTLTDPQHWDDEPFEAIVSNPPYSIRWDGDANPLLINDPRFAPAGVLAPKSKADLAFTMHMLSWLAVNGTAAIVEFPGVLYRSGAEQKIRKYLIDNNYIDTVIQLPPNLFFGTTIATSIIVLKKSKADNKTLFIDASREFVRRGNKNKLAEANQQKILDAFTARADADHFANLVENSAIAENGYNIAVSAYVEVEHPRQAVDIEELNAEIARIVVRQAELRQDIDRIVADREQDVEKLAAAARGLPPNANVYLEEDFVMNLLETVLDYMLQTEVVVRALERFRENRWSEVRTLDDLERLMARFPDDQAGNTALAQYLWGYNFWTRAQQLRDLAHYFRGIGVDNQERLKQWALTSTFKKSFEGRVIGLGPAVYQWLVMRQGVDTVKPDVHVRRFAEAAVGRKLNDQDVIELTTKAAARIGIKAFELDWRIWEAARGGALPYPTAPG